MNQLSSIGSAKSEKNFARDPPRPRPTFAGMSFYIGLIFWLVLAAVLAAGVVMAAKGSMVLLAISMVVFVAGFIKYGCLTH